MYTFQHIEYLLVLVVLVPLWALYAWLIRWKKARLSKIGDARLVAMLTADYSSRKFLIKFVLVNVAIVLGALALANPRKPMGSTNVKRNGIDIMIALDVSKSMLAQDIKPNRLERAKQFVAKLIDGQPDDRIGIVVFAGRAYLQMPLTSDHAAAKMYLSSASTDVVPTQGTVISDALRMCYAGFNTKEKKYKSIVLISDGEDHDESAEQTAKLLAEEGVVINTVGMGSPDGSVIQDNNTGELKRDASGRIVISKLNETGLKRIAAVTNGTYLLYSNADDVVKGIAGQLKTMGQHSITESSMLSYNYLFQWLLGGLLLVLIIELFMKERKSASSPKRMTARAGAAAAVLVVSILSIQAHAQDAKALVQKGNDAYNKKAYADAAGHYQEALQKNGTSTTAPFNLGNALYKTGKAEDALKAYDVAINNSKTPADKASAWYNKGVVLQNGKKLPECITAYKNALKLNPKDEDTRLNLQKALLEQKKQEQEKKQKDQQQQQQQPSNKKQQSPQQQQNNQPKPQPSKMTRKEAEEKLKALMQQEKNLQDKLRRVDAASPNRPDKDW